MVTQSREEIQKEMDEAAVTAEETIPVEDLEAFRKVATWWREHFKMAGHKRLGRILVKHDVKQS